MSLIVISSLIGGAVIGYFTKSYVSREIQPIQPVQPDSAFEFNRFQKKRYNKFIQSINGTIQTHLGAVGFNTGVDVWLILSDCPVKRTQEQRVLNHIRKEFINQGWDVGEQRYEKTTKVFGGQAVDYHKATMEFKFSEEFIERQKASQKEADEIIKGK